MSGKVSFIALIALILGAVFVILERDGERSSDRLTSDRLLSSIAWDKVSSVQIKNNVQLLNLELEDSKWIVGGDYEYPAEYSKVRELLFKLSRIGKSMSVSYNKKQAAEFGLDLENVITLSFFGKEGEPLSSVRIGAKRDMTSDPSSGRVVDGGFYVSGEDGKVYLVREDLNLDLSPKQWISRSLLSVLSSRVAGLEQFSVLGATEKLEFKLAAGDTGPLLVSPTIPEGQELRSGRAENVFNSLENLRVEDVLKTGSLDLEFDRKTRIFTGSGLVYLAETAKVDEKFYLRIRGEINPEINSEFNRREKLKFDERTNLTDMTEDQSNASPEESDSDKIERPERLKEFKPVSLVTKESVEKVNQKHSAWIYQIPVYTAQKLRFLAADIAQDASPKDPANELSP